MAVSNIKKNARGYGYTYTDLAAIHEQLEALGWTYYQFIETEGADDYIYTVLIIDGKEQAPRRGCKIIETVVTGKDGKAKTNPAQSYGSGLTYARRYSLLMACGFATTDDDAATLDGTVKARPRSKAEREGEEICKALAAEVGLDLKTVLAKKNMSDLADLSEAELSKLATWLEGKRNV